MAEEKRDARQGEGWMFPAGLALLWVIAGVAAVAIGVIVLIAVAT
jgi:hypothetical protein